MRLLRINMPLKYSSHSLPPLKPIYSLKLVLNEVFFCMNLIFFFAL